MNPFGFDPTKNPLLDVGKLMESMKLPGLDVNALLEAQRKNIEALTQANQLAYAGMQELARRQAEIFQRAMTQWQSAMAQMGSMSPGSVSGQADLARQAMEKAIAGMREMAEAAVQAQSPAWQVIQKRTEEGIAELTRLSQRK